MKKLMRKKLALMLATLKKKRPYYCEVEYIQSHIDSERIETGIYFDSSKDMDVEMMVYLPSGNTASRWLLIGDHVTGTNSTNLEMTKSGTNANKLRMYLNRGGSDRYSSEISNYEDKVIKFKFIHTASNNYYEATLDGTSLSRTYATSYANNVNPLSFFRDFRANPNKIFGGLRIYSCKIKVDGVLVRHFIPVLDWDMTPCLYDKVTNKLIYNTGTGTLDYGREIHPVEYIKGTGTQYFDSGVATSTTIISECTCQYDPDATYVTSIIFGSGTTMDENNDRYQAIFSTNGTNYSSRLDGSARLLSNLDVTVKRTVRLNPVAKRFYVDDTSGIINYSGTLNNNNIYFFARNMTDPADVYNPTKMLFYGGKQWNDETLIRDFIPAIDENGVAFAFDKVEHTIHDNIGTGYFKYPDVELEYLESDGNQYIETNFSPTSNSGLDITYAYPEIGSQASGICGTYKGSSPRRDTLFVSTSNGTTNSSLYLFHRGVTLNTGTIPTAGVFYNAKINWLNDGKLNFNNGTLTDDVGTNTVIAQSIRLFSRYNNANGTWSNSVARIKSARLSESLNVSMDFIPVYHNGVACMYDKVSQTYFPNAGTGTFGCVIKEKR